MDERRIGPVDTKKHQDFVEGLTIEPLLAPIKLTREAIRDRGWREGLKYASLVFGIPLITGSLIGVMGSDYNLLTGSATGLLPRILTGVEIGCLAYMWGGFSLMIRQDPSNK